MFLVDIALEGFFVQTLFISLVYFAPNGGSVEGVPIGSSAQDNIIESQNKTQPINVTNIEKNALHEQSTKISPVNATTGYPTPTGLHIVLGEDKTNNYSGKIYTATGTSTTASTGSWPTNTAFTISTTVIPGSVKHKTHSFKMKILEYVLIPVGFVLAIIMSYCLVRHIQRVRRKRRLERELLHQYSYPNSEADDVENEQSITEIDSIVNSQFVAYNDHNVDKAVSDATPQVTVTIGGTSIPTVKQDHVENLEQSTSFNT